MKCGERIGTEGLVRTIDTRFFLTHFLADTDELKRKAKAKMIELRREGAVVPTIVIHEVYKFEYQRFGREVADKELRSIEAAGFSIIELSVEIAKNAALLRCKYPKLPTADAIIAASGMEQRASRVVSDDEHFDGVREIKTEWL